MCAACNKSYLRETHLQAHARSHLPGSDRPFECPEEGCTKRFWTVQHLKVHESTHKGEKLWKVVSDSNPPKEFRLSGQFSVYGDGLPADFCETPSSQSAYFHRTLAFWDEAISVRTFGLPKVIRYEPKAAGSSENARREALLLFA